MRGLILWFNFRVNIGTNILTDVYDTNTNKQPFDREVPVFYPSEKSKFRSTNDIIGFAFRRQQESCCLATESSRLKLLI